MLCLILILCLSADNNRGCLVSSALWLLTPVCFGVRAELFIQADCPAIQIKQNHISVRLLIKVRLLRTTDITEDNYHFIRIIVHISTETETVRLLIVDTIRKRS